MGALFGFIFSMLMAVLFISIAGDVDLRISTLECKAGIHSEHHILQGWVLKAMNDVPECQP